MPMPKFPPQRIPPEDVHWRCVHTEVMCAWRSGHARDMSTLELCALGRWLTTSMRPSCIWIQNVRKSKILAQSCLTWWGELGLFISATAYKIMHSLRWCRIFKRKAKHLNGRIISNSSQITARLPPSSGPIQPRRLLWQEAAAEAEIHAWISCTCNPERSSTWPEADHKQEENIRVERNLT